MNLVAVVNYVLMVVLYWLLSGNILLSFVYCAIVLCGLYAFRIYECLDDIRESVVRSVVGTVFASLFFVLICAIFDIPFWGWELVISVFALPVSVSLLNYVFSKHFLKRGPVIKYLVVGKENEIYHVLKEIEEKSRGRYRFVEYINPEPAVFKEKVAQYDRVLITDPKLEKEIRAELDQINETHSVEYLPNLSERVLKRIPIEVLVKFGDYYKVCFDNIRESPAKRVMDIVFSIIGLIAYSPFIVSSALWILIEDGRPVFFKQPRVGKNEKVFEMVKLRSLKNSKIDPTNPNKDIEERILKIGKFIRKTRIDESVQFWLVLKGVMSLVGPRPEMVEYHTMMKQHIPYYTYRLLVKPGLTGWAQINYKHSSTLEEYKIKTEYDLYYVKNRSIFLDLKILLQTLETLLLTRGAR